MCTAASNGVLHVAKAVLHVAKAVLACQLAWRASKRPAVTKSLLAVDALA